jgi:hypothetical protein
MSGLEESFIAGIMLAWLTIGVLKIVAMNFKEEN